MNRWLPVLRAARSDIVSEAVEQLGASGSSLARHEAEYLAKICVNAYLVALSQGEREHFGEVMAAVAEREARAGNALRVEAVVLGLDLLAARVRELAVLSLEHGHGPDPVELAETGRSRFLSVYLRAKAAEDDRQAQALETYAEAVDQVPEIVYSTDEHGNITDINHLAAAMLGYRKEDLLGRHHSLLMRPEDAERFHHAVQERRTEERATRRARVTLRSADGSLAEYELSSTGVYSPDGRYLGTDGVARAANEGATELRYHLDDEGRFVDISEDAAAVLGFRRDELVGGHFSQIMDPRERERVGRMFGERRKDERAARSLRVVLTGRDGSPREFEISAAGRYDSEGRFVGTVGLGHDLTARSTLEREVAEGRRRYRRAFDHAGLGLAMISPDLVVREANAWHHRRRRRPIGGTPCYVGLFGNNAECEWCGLFEAVRAGSSVVRDDVVSPLDGRSYALVFTPVHGDDGIVTEVIEAVIDTTAERERRARVNAADKRAALRRLATGVARPLDDSLSAVALHAALAEESNLRNAVDDALNRLRGFQRVSGAAPAPPGAACDLNAVVQTVVESLASRHHRVDAECDLLPTMPPVAMPAADAAEVVRHLLQNAVEAMPEGGSLTIETVGSVERGISLRVTDTGEGMTEEVARQALDPFFSTRGAEHEGLGLSHADSLTRLHGGRLEVSSSPGSGTTVEVWLPAAAATPCASPAPPPAAAPAARLSVAVRLESEVLLQAVCSFICARGHAVADGPVADVWLVDSPAPWQANGPTVVLTGPGAVTPTGVVALPKPFTGDELLAALERAVG